jgi:6-phosphofructokinase 2
MTSIVTVTANPAIDVSTSVDKLFAMHKLRCTVARRDPGGGGVNVARVVQRLGGDVAAVYLAGGLTGQLLRRLVEREGIESVAIEISEETREDFTVLEQASSQQYRFVLPGPLVKDSEWHSCLESVEQKTEVAGFIVASGSLPPGVPDDFYARLARLSKDQGCNMVLDTGGAALAAALKEGVYLVKPNLRELQELVHAPLVRETDWIDASRRLIDSGGAQVVALTLGHHGALVTTVSSALRALALPIRAVSAVGAGDSFLGAMVWSLANGMNLT